MHYIRILLVAYNAATLLGTSMWQMGSLIENLLEIHLFSYFQGAQQNQKAKYFKCF